ncbi:threonine ammonia-lyase [Microbacterium sp.]|uniref:threonine ammonia-lyase n=1 Tax=Microbacterium sp. TaxID=51671 RepID=UPI002BE6FF50|nr:pyridoxal-phosphate dependent enzyme [Microbacterium sp.]HET6301564.1 pyridoxal-phosphate dependent enzyme [Microbacterium sp.]HWL77629.1 pyridoxal-phosphate dependent enzyme [Microbacterium sp.]
MVGLSAERIESAVELIEPVFVDTPQFRDAALSRALGRDVVLKLETLNPVRSFKGRGASLLMRDLAPGQRVVTASAGNFGLAMAYAGMLRGVDVTVYCAATANATKVARIRDVGAEVIVRGADFDVAKEAAREHAAVEGHRFVEDGDDLRITEGAGTIAVELADQAPDVIVVPVGNGALATGIGCWVRTRRPGCRVIGVSAAGAPAMANAWRTGIPAATDRANTIADGVAVRVPVPSIIPMFREYVDDMLLVEDEVIWHALSLVRDTVGLILEPSAVVGIAAIMQHGIPGARVATIATGSNYSEQLLRQITGVDDRPRRPLP